MDDITKKNEVEIIFICYHYLKRNDAYHRIWGYSFDIFKSQIDFISNEYQPVSFERFINFLAKEEDLPLKCCVFSFDDGLVEHAELIAPYLYKKNISALFFPPTCIFTNEMAIPQIIHFYTAKYGIKNFYSVLKKYFKVTGLSWDNYFHAVDPVSTNDILQFYSQIKVVLYKLLPPIALKLLLQTIFESVLLKDDPQILDKVYMNKKHLTNLKKMGHAVGCHTHSHLYLQDNILTDKFIQAEILNPKSILEEIIDKKISVFAYPFGGNIKEFDIKNWADILRQIGFKYAVNAYRVFSGDKIFNPFWIERYSVQGEDNNSDIIKKVYKYHFV